ncbi:MAG TPA: hexitol phosphatase HxpB [Bacteroidia bacterium]|jgi:HAD superfamily hydrolase (TIGR01509 family)|nr:hexitol phosphatase HxpB [Bacteroidia bacterium]
MPGLFVFDMDGVIIDSEPLWRIAMVKVFNSSGLPVDAETCAQTTGMRIDEVIRRWNKKNPFTSDEVQVQNDIEEELCKLIIEQGKAMPGFFAAIELIKSQDKKIALATSSSERLVDCVLNTLSIKDHFTHVQSAEKLAYGKPHPEVFMLCAQATNHHYSNCVAFEDSLNGIISAKSAGMKVIAVPEEKNHHNPKFVVADIILRSLEEFTLQTIHQIKTT